MGMVLGRLKQMFGNSINVLDAGLRLFVEGDGELPDETIEDQLDQYLLFSTLPNCNSFAIELAMNPLFVSWSRNSPILRMRSSPLLSPLMARHQWKQRRG
jgi:hypothetical protein